MITIQNQNFGVEIELTGITRQAAAQVIADYYGTIGTRFMGTVYKTYEAVDNKGRRWKCMRDASITPQRRVNGHVLDANDEYKCEVVTPILQYEDIPDLQAIVRALVKKGAMANASCGIHVHVDGANHTPESLSRLLNFAAGRQDLFYESLQIGERADQWCHKISPELFKAMKKQGRSSRAAAEEIWYSSVNDGYSGGISHGHYNQTRYHGINLHAFFTKGTVEFRLFNGTTHAGRIKAYIQFCLAMSAWSINCDHDNLHFKSIAGYTQQQKHDLMMRVLTKRLGMQCHPRPQGIAHHGNATGQPLVDLLGQPAELAAKVRAGASGAGKVAVLGKVMFSRQQITIIHIVEGCKLLKNMSVFFQSNATP